MYPCSVGLQAIEGGMRKQSAGCVVDGCRGRVKLETGLTQLIEFAYAGIVVLETSHG